MNIIDIKHHEQKISDKAKGDFKMISTVTMAQESDNIHSAKVITITQNKYPLSSRKNLQKRFSKEHSVFNLNEFLYSELPMDHVMLLKNFCS